MPRNVKPARLPRGMRQPKLISAESRAEMSFNRLMAQHPEVYDGFKRLAYQLLRAGRTHYGAKCIVEVLRFETALSAKASGDAWKINNDATAYMARALADEDPAFLTFFEFRRQPSASSEVAA